MTPEQGRAFLGFFLQTMQMESPTTRKIIAAVPEDRKDYRPDPKSKSAAELAWHLATAEVWFLNGVANCAFPMEGDPAMPGTVAEMLAFYDEQFKAGLDRVQAMTDDQLLKPVPFFGMMEMPAVMYLSFLTHHSAHHRGQLSAYLRPMGAKVPGIYGGSADEPFEMAANA